MTITLAHRAPRATPVPSWQAGWRAPAEPVAYGPFGPSEADSMQRRFDRMRAGFTARGGFVPADLVSQLMRAHWEQPLSRVARWIAGREVVSVTWQTQVWLPLFQFERPSLDVRGPVSEIVRDLRPVYDDWAMAEWFAAPHDLLAGRAPVAAVAHDPDAVRAAARRDRFVNRW